MMSLGLKTGVCRMRHLVCAAGLVLCLASPAPASDTGHRPLGSSPSVFDVLLELANGSRSIVCDLMQHHLEYGVLLNNQDGLDGIDAKATVAIVERLTWRDTRVLLQALTANDTATIPTLAADSLKLESERFDEWTTRAQRWFRKSPPLLKLDLSERPTMEWSTTKDPWVDGNLTEVFGVVTMVCSKLASATSEDRIRLGTLLGYISVNDGPGVLPEALSGACPPRTVATSLEALPSIPLRLMIAEQLFTWEMAVRFGNG